MIAPIPSGDVLVWDFDGVLCDAFDECLLISWCAHMGAPVQAFAEDGLAAVPADVADRFRLARPFMRQLAHFLVPLLDEPAPVDRAAFVARFARVPQAQAAAFVVAATAYREAVRRLYPARWYAYHSVWPRLASLVAGAYMATARDRASVTAILSAHGVAMDPARVFDSLRHKPDALRSIAIRASVPRGRVWLVDDGIENCLAAKAARFGACWASWGYNVRGDEAIARAHGIPVLALDDLPAG